MSFLHPYTAFITLNSLLLFSSSALATTTAAETQTTTPSSGESAAATPYCEVNARFLQARHEVRNGTFNGVPFREPSIVWTLRIQSVNPVGAATCPDGNEFEVTIRGGDAVVESNGDLTLVYPVHISPPEPQSDLTLRVARHELRDPRDGFSARQWLLAQ